MYREHSLVGLSLVMLFFQSFRNVFGQHRFADTLIVHVDQLGANSASKGFIANLPGLP